MPNKNDYSGGGGGGFGGRSGGRGSDSGRGRNVYDIRTGKTVSKRTAAKGAKAQAKAKAKSMHPSTIARQKNPNITVNKNPSVSRVAHAKRVAKRIATSPASRDLKKVASNKTVKKTVAAGLTAAAIKKTYGSKPKPSPKPSMKPKPKPSLRKMPSPAQIKKMYYQTHSNERMPIGDFELIIRKQYGYKNQIDKP